MTDVPSGPTGPSRFRWDRRSLLHFHHAKYAYEVLVIDGTGGRVARSILEGDIERLLQLIPLSEHQSLALLLEEFKVIHPRHGLGFIIKIVPRSSDLPAQENAQGKELPIHEDRWVVTVCEMKDGTYQG